MSRVTLKELRLRNYRAFADARLVLDDVTFLVGRNGAGKSTLMDALSFASEAVTDSLGTALERRGNFLGSFPATRARRLEMVSPSPFASNARAFRRSSTVSQSDGIQEEPDIASGRRSSKAIGPRHSNETRRVFAAASIHSSQSLIGKRSSFP